MVPPHLGYPKNFVCLFATKAVMAAQGVSEAARKLAERRPDSYEGAWIEAKAR